ncbi:uncharacterized protein JN550_000698 [Neoarthrinium moseri]|uniref:uncharacterized protein n=1 Tax=Neoarthrinium moseri TaxID=1658444 RepID=UPI001FDB01BD|nr:uncharacterized protein JN550_000698 [Neoarthrinium moseri]KAI1878516.1 hypothetical protein JN550_000698 [Neoarthrinium moseri]
MDPLMDVEVKQVFCVYPISGNYTIYQRTLFWVALAFALLGQTHGWLAASAFGFAVTYSTTAAVHGFILAFQGEVQCDGDIFVVDAIITRALHISIICALICPRLFNKSLALLVNGWFLLLGASHMALAFNTPRLISKASSSLVLSYRNEDGSWHDPCADMRMPTMFRGISGDSMSPVLWGYTTITNASLLQLSADSDVISMPSPERPGAVAGYMLLESIKVSLLMAPVLQATLVDRRSSRNDVFLRLLSKRVVYQTSDFSRSGPVLATVLVRLLQVRWFLLQCVPALNILDFPLRFTTRVLCGYFKIRTLKIEDLSFKETRITQARYQAAKYIAMSFYAIVMLGHVLWMPVFLQMTTSHEGWLKDVPESETFRAVGQWSSWLTLCLALTTAIVNRLLNLDTREGSASLESWIQQHHLNVIYSQVRNWCSDEWIETKDWWANPGKRGINHLKAAVPDDDSQDMFSTKLLQALTLFEANRKGDVLPAPVPIHMQPFFGRRPQEKMD